MTRAPRLSRGTRAGQALPKPRRRRRRSSSRNTGAPISAVIAPTGSCRGAASVRLAMSARQSSAPPHSAAPGATKPVIGGAQRQPHQVRRDQADEADRPGGEHREAQSAPLRPRTPPDARTADIEAEHGAAQLAGGEHVQRPAAEQGRGERRSPPRRGRPRVLRPAEVARRARTPCRAAGRCRRSPAAPITSAPQALASTDAGEQQPAESPPLPSAVRPSAPTRARRRWRSTARAQRVAGEHAGQRADRGAAGDTEHERVGERIAEQGLQQHARQRQQAADREGRQRCAAMRDACARW